MARHRSPSGRHHPSASAGRASSRRRAAHRLPTPALRGAAVVGAVISGAVVMSQTISLVPAEADPAAETLMNAARASSVDPPATAPPAVELATLGVPRDPAQEVQALAKGVALAEERGAPAGPITDVIEDVLGGEECSTSGFNGVASHVAQAGHLLQDRFGVEDVGGVASRPGNSASDHPRGYALDFMVDEETGDALAAYAEEHSEELGIKYIMWQVADHYDHVHISFDDEPGSGLSC